MKRQLVFVSAHLFLFFVSAFGGSAFGQAPAPSRDYTEKEFDGMLTCVEQTQIAWTFAERKLEGLGLASAKKSYDADPPAEAKDLRLRIIERVYSDSFKGSWNYGVAFFQECSQKQAGVSQERSMGAGHCMQNAMIAMTAATYRQRAQPIAGAYARFAVLKSDIPRAIIDRVYAGSKARNEAGMDEWKACTAHLVTGEPGQVSFQVRNLVPLTAEKIETLSATTNNPSGDSYLGSREDLKLIVDAFVADNSKSDPIHLYLAARTAYRIGDIRDAGFLFYAAQIRKHLDAKRFTPPETELGEKDLPIYQDFLNQTIGEAVNPAVAKDPATFNAVVEMIRQWKADPAADALYPSAMYGIYAVRREQWPAMGEAEKKDFVDNFVAVVKKRLGRP